MITPVDTEITTSATRWVVSRFDSALDPECMDIDAYAKTYDLAAVRTKPGETATEWCITPLPHYETGELATQCRNTTEAIAELLRYCLVDARHWTERLAFEWPVGAHRRRLTAASARAIPGPVRTELGLISLRWSSLKDDERKNCLPPASLTR